MNSCKGKSFLIFHPALGYFARDYGLSQITIEVEGKESLLQPI
jgi:zinc transport system substrate-binding protein